MTEPLRRRSLLPTHAVRPSVVNEADIAAVANAHGFERMQTPPPLSDAVSRRQKPATGRDHQFNVRLRRDTLNFIYGEANSRNVPIAQIIEEMVEVLRRNR